MATFNYLQNFQSILESKSPTLPYKSSNSISYMLWNWAWCTQRATHNASHNNRMRCSISTSGSQLFIAVHFAAIVPSLVSTVSSYYSHNLYHLRPGITMDVTSSEWKIKWHVIKIYLSTLVDLIACWPIKAQLIWWLVHSNFVHGHNCIIIMQVDENFIQSTSMVSGVRFIHANIQSQIFTMEISKSSNFCPNLKWCHKGFFLVNLSLIFTKITSKQCKNPSEGPFCPLFGYILASFFGNLLRFSIVSTLLVV